MWKYSLKINEQNDFYFFSGITLACILGQKTAPSPNQFQ